MTRTREMLARVEQEQRTLRDLLEAVGSEVELRDLLTRILRAACELLDADHGTIGLVDEVRRVVRTEAGFNMPPNELGAEMAEGEGVAGEVLRTRRPVVLRRYGDLARPTQPAMLEHSVLGMPITWRGAMIGFFGIGRSASVRGVDAPPLFSRADRDTLATFARDAAIAIRLARGIALERQRAERLALITHVGRMITADLRVEQLLQNAADALHEVLGYPNIAIPLLEKSKGGGGANDPDILVLGAVGGHYKHLIHGEYRLPVTEGIMGAAVRGRQPILVNDVTKDPRYVLAPGSVGIIAELAVPIMLGGECLGVLNVESAQPLTRDDGEHLRIVADQLAVAIDNARLHAAAGELAVLDERHRLSRDLHDSVTQLVFSITLVAQSLAPAWQRDPAEGARRVARVVELSQQAMGELRTMLTELRSAADATTKLRRGETARGVEPVRRLGLADAIREHARRLTNDGLQVRVRVRAYAPLRPDVEDALYRIAQEALFNVVKHARATRAVVELSRSATHTSLRVSDDGVGMPPDRTKPTGVGEGIESTATQATGYGLGFMRERAEAFAGALRIGRRTGGGAIIEVRIPRSGMAGA